MATLNSETLLNLRVLFSFTVSQLDINLGLNRLQRLYDSDIIEPSWLEDHEDFINFLVNKFSIATALQTIKTVILLLHYYGQFETQDNYLAEYENLLDMKVNSALYILDWQNVNDFLDKNLLHYLGNEKCFSKYRHFLLLFLVVKEIPLKFSSITNIRYLYHNFNDKSDCLKDSIYLLRKGQDFYFYFNIKNKRSHKKQIEYKITNNDTRKLLLVYFSKFCKNLKFLFTTSGGKCCSESNIANSLANFTRQHFKMPITLSEIRSEWERYPRTELQKEICKYF